MTPLERYQEDLKRDDFHHDEAQEMAVRHLQRVYDELVAYERPRQGFLDRLMKRDPDVEPVKGLYFWGGVGRGKTYLVDTFFDSLPFKDKWRTHFHRFMQRVHNDLREFDGEKNPLELVARKLASEVRVLCLDEFFVKDITDAMILANLLQGLFKRGVTLVTTSNIVPDGLYKDGLQRARFLPAIDLLKRYTEVVNVDSGVDYRLRTLTQARLFHHPLNDQAEQAMLESFKTMVRGAEGQVDVSVPINHRVITAKRLYDGIVWFDFDALCDGPRSQNDYIELSKEFHTVLLSGVPQLGRENDDQTRRFINLVDEFYDRCVKMIISAEVGIDEIYTGGNLAFEIERTQSRLLEMQSQEYLEREHKP
ncbi:ATPase [Terasakiispira papahanaumokuakeensis]|uniref:Cell division protein ZapE n=1 Tax=Terasakiispira papahanaumokuakeensis TaxID=197479 RepID=A0A1E2V6Z1_9GAMM|nr:cell division protein ZapE [Terasakiispira papahanaumokuakeensis]ODC02683.1 ATPase [Terasakiispira papahanaumokuakeensis]